MDYLNIRYAVAAARLSSSPNAGATLVEQLEPLFAKTPYLLLDMEGVLLTSMHLGELVNLAHAARDRWGERWPGLLLVRAGDQARRAIGLAHLEPILRLFPDADAALAEAADWAREPDEEPAAGHA